MEFSERYPPPDPEDPFAPLWVLRRKAAAHSTRSHRHFTTEALEPPAHLRNAGVMKQRPQSGSFELPARRHENHRGSLDLCFPSPPTTNEIYSKVTFARSHSTIPWIGQPSLPPSPSSSSVRLPETHPHFGDTWTVPLGMAVGIPDLAHTKSPRARSLGLRPVASTTAMSVGKSHKKSRSNVIHGARQQRSLTKTFRSDTTLGGPWTSVDFRTLQSDPAPTSEFGRLAIPHKRLNNQSTRSTATSKGRPAISPPIISTATWESSVAATGRTFLPMSSNPIFNNALSVQQSNAQLYRRPVSISVPLVTGEGENRAQKSDKSQVVHISPRLNMEHNLRTQGPGSLPPPSNLRHCLQSDMNPTSSNPTTPLSIKCGVPVPPSLLAAESPLSTCANTTNLVLQASSADSTDRSLETARSVPQDAESTTARNDINHLSPEPFNAFSDHFTASELSNGKPPAAKSKANPILSTISLVPQTEWSLPTNSQLAYAASLPIFQSGGTSIRFGSLFEEYRVIVLFLRHYFCPLSQAYVSALTSLVRQPAFTENPVLCDFDADLARVAVAGDGDKAQSGPKQVQLVLIGCGSPALVEKYREMFELPFRMFVDPDGKLYEALGMRKYVPELSKKGEPPILPSRQISRENKSTPPLAGTADPLGKGSKDGDQNVLKVGMMKGIAMVVLRSLKVGMPVWENGGDITQLGGEFVIGPGLTCSYAHRMQTPRGHAPIIDVLKAGNVTIPGAEKSHARNPPAAELRLGKGGVLRKWKSSSSSLVNKPGGIIRDASPAPILIRMTTDTTTNPSDAIASRINTVTGDTCSDDLKSHRRDTFVSQTLRSMDVSSTFLPAFMDINGSHESFGCRTVVGVGRVSESSLSSSQSFSRELEDQWTETRRQQLERLRQRKDARRTGSSLDASSGCRPEWAEPDQPIMPVDAANNNSVASPPEQESRFKENLSTLNLNLEPTLSLISSKEAESQASSSSTPPSPVKATTRQSRRTHKVAASMYSLPDAIIGGGGMAIGIASFPVPALPPMPPKPKKAYKETKTRSFSTYVRDLLAND